MKFTQLQNQEQTVLPTIGSGNLHAVKKILYVSCDYFFFFTIKATNTKLLK